jgi:hypothetical protein
MITEINTHLPPSTNPCAAFSRKSWTLWLPLGATPKYSRALTCKVIYQLTIHEGYNNQKYSTHSHASGVPNNKVITVSRTKQNGPTFTIFLVKNLPTAVKRKLFSEKWVVSKGRYHGIGEPTARSFDHMTFKGRIIKCFRCQLWKRERDGDCSLTSKPAFFRASMHCPVDLMSGRPSPISISDCTN